MFLSPGKLGLLEEARSTSTKYSPRVGRRYRMCRLYLGHLLLPEQVRVRPNIASAAVQMFTVHLFSAYS